jgi:hypothetical protein
MVGLVKPPMNADKRRWIQDPYLYSSAFIGGSSAFF